MKTIIISLFILFMTAIANAAEIQGMAGANSTTYDEATDANTWGVSVRGTYKFSHEPDGWLLYLNSPGMSLLAGQFCGAYRWRTTSNFFWEGGLGACYGRIYGPSPFVSFGFGYKVSQNFFFNFPVVITRGVFWGPLVGWSF